MKTRSRLNGCSPNISGSREKGQSEAEKEKTPLKISLNF